MKQNKRIFIEGVSGTGKTYFYLPNVIKLIGNPSGKIYAIKGFSEFNFKGKHWKGIDVLDFDMDKITKNDLIICEEPGIIRNETLLKTLGDHPFVIITDPQPVETFQFLDPIKFTVIKSEYLRPKKFPFNLFDQRAKQKLSELQSKVRGN